MGIARAITPAEVMKPMVPEMPDQIPESDQDQGVSEELRLLAHGKRDDETDGQIKGVPQPKRCSPQQRTPSSRSCQRCRHKHTSVREIGGHIASYDR
jgi:hypothetical protein